MVLSMYTKQRIVALKSQGLSCTAISRRLLKDERIKVSRQTVWALLKRYKYTRTVRRMPGSGRPAKTSDPRVMAIVEKGMRQDDETTAVQLHRLLVANGVDISVTTILRSRSNLGWTFRGSAYCQMIREANKTKRLQWAREYQHDDFRNVVWTDESTVQLESHKRMCCRKTGERPKPKPRPKHPVKVHVWAGISWSGRSELVIFEGIMNATLYIEVLQHGLLPFLGRVYPRGHRFMQDNDPKHTSRAAQEFFRENNVNWWKTPPESPDANPIENLWHEMKEYIRREVKPKRKQELIDGIHAFWATVDINKCRRYIGHLRKVLPRIIDLSGAATGY